MKMNFRTPNQIYQLKIKLMQFEKKWLLKKNYVFVITPTITYLVSVPRFKVVISFVVLSKIFDLLGKCILTQCFSYLCAIVTTYL